MHIRRRECVGLAQEREKKNDSSFQSLCCVYMLFFIFKFKTNGVDP